jgi:hypothetical protein
MSMFTALSFAALAPFPLMVGDIGLVPPQGRPYRPSRGNLGDYLFSVSLEFT